MFWEGSTDWIMMASPTAGSLSCNVTPNLSTAAHQNQGKVHIGLNVP